MKLKRILSVLIILSVMVVGTVSVWPEEDAPFHAWPGLVDITLMDLDSTPRYGRDDPASIMSGAASYWGRAVDQDGNPMKGATLTAQLGVHFGHGQGPKTWSKQILLGDDGTFTLAGGSGMGIGITVAKRGYTPYDRYYYLHPAKERFRPTKDAPEELIVWRNVGHGMRRNAEIETTVPWPLCQHFRLDLVQRKVVGPEEPGDFEIRIPLNVEPFEDGKFQVPREIGAILSTIDGAFGFCREPTSKVYSIEAGPAHWSWQPSDDHPLISESSFGGIRNVYSPFETLSFLPMEAVKQLPKAQQFSERSRTHGDMRGLRMAFHSRNGQIAGRISLEDAGFLPGDRHRPPGYFIRLLGEVAQGSHGWNEREPEPELLLPDPEP